MHQDRAHATAPTTRAASGGGGDRLSSLGNAFGHFTGDGRAFVVTDPRTPMPWINVVSNGRIGFVVSQNGGGFSWLDNSQLNVLTRWEMDLVRDGWGKFVYVSDRESGEVWSLAPHPCRTRFDSYRAEFTQGSAAFHTLAHGIRAAWTMSVGPDASQAGQAEVWTVELANESARTRKLRACSFFEWCCGAAPDAKREFHRLFFTVSHDARRAAVVARKNMWDVPDKDEKRHWNIAWPYVAAHACSGPFEGRVAIGDKATFLGRYGDQARPGAMTDAKPAAGGFGRFGDAAAAVGGDLTLAPGQKATLVFVIAVAPSEDEVLATVDRFLAPEAAKGAIEGSRATWDRLCGATTVATGAADFDLLNNRWLVYQAICGRLWARTGYYQQSGAFGYRDQLQDSQAWLPIDPGKTREQILLHAAHQFKDGSVYHWWHPLAAPAREFGLPTRCSDDLHWLAFVTANYLKETGDFGVLEARAPFVDDPNAVTLMEHVERAFARLEKGWMSPRGLPLIGSCDWNDGLSAVGVDMKGESVWLAFFLMSIFADWAVVYERVGDKAKAEGMRGKGAAMREAVNRHAWDERGGYFKCATLDSGGWIGSSENADGKLYLNPQTWAILTDGAEEGRQASAWGAVTRELLSPGGPLLLAPAYTEPDEAIGYITRYAPGLRENGGCYMHAATWALAAAARRRDVASVERIWKSVSPAARCSDKEGAGAEAYRAEPYVTPGNVDGPRSAYPGRAGWTWYTGSAAWLNRVSLEHVLGIRASWEGLTIDPCPWAGLGQVEATRTWRGRKVRVRFDAGAFVPGEAARLVVNGRAIAPPGAVLTESMAGPAGAMVDVEVRWGGGDGSGGTQVRTGQGLVGSGRMQP